MWQHWGALALAIVLEVLGTTVMKVSHGWGFPHAAALGLGVMWLCVALSYYCLSLATTVLPVGVAFACWEAAGLALITLSSVFVVGEMLTLRRFLGLCCVLGGALLVHLGTGSGHRSGSQPPHASQPPQDSMPQTGHLQRPEPAQSNRGRTAAQGCTRQEDNHA